jgi:hypothetical protein
MSRSSDAKVHTNQLDREARSAVRSFAAIIALFAIRLAVAVDE